MSHTREYCLEQLDAVLASYNVVKAKSQYDDMSGAPREDYQKVIGMALAAIERLAGKSSAYWRQATEIADREKLSECLQIQMIAGVIQSLRHDYEKGYIKHLSELIHGEVFGDYLEMADILLEGGYKDASAVIAGSTLEAHLRRLCAKFEVLVEIVTADAPARAKKAEQLNTELVAASAYSKLDQKSVTAWLDLRNKAAHGKYREYSKDQVSLLVMGIRDFITRNPG